jgi:glycosyltransferase involved in cell wall biosynthesis
MKIAILGTRGIPNHYGGFEQITEWLSAGLVERGHDVTVYNPHHHAYKQNDWNGVNIVHCYDPLFLKTTGQFIYDLNCIIDSRKRNFDIILFMGYTSSSVWASFFPKQSVIVSNMDGFEWKRARYSKPVKRFLRFAESLAVKYSDHHIADSRAMQDYLEENYFTSSCYIPYGPKTVEEPYKYNISIDPGYFLLMARMEPENNIEMILDGFVSSNVQKKFLVIGNTKTKLGKRLVAKYHDDRIIFMGGIFEAGTVERLRKNACLYFHGHSVGGTNPSLLEAMNSGSLIAAHNNPFNAAVLKTGALYFSSSDQVKEIIEKTMHAADREEMIRNNFKRLEDEFNREKVIVQYESFLKECLAAREEEFLLNEYPKLVK